LGDRKVNEYYSKLEIERMICWVDSQRQYYQALKYKIPEIVYIQAVEEKIESLNRIVYKWQYRLSGIKLIEK
jgi:hypothetical protein